MPCPIRRLRRQRPENTALEKCCGPSCRVPRCTYGSELYGNSRRTHNAIPTGDGLSSPVRRQFGGSRPAGRAGEPGRGSTSAQQGDTLAPSRFDPHPKRRDLFAQDAHPCVHRSWLEFTAFLPSKLVGPFLPKPLGCCLGLFAGEVRSNYPTR